MHFVTKTADCNCCAFHFSFTAIPIDKVQLSHDLSHGSSEISSEKWVFMGIINRLAFLIFRYIFRCLTFTMIFFWRAPHLNTLLDKLDQMHTHFMHSQLKLFDITSHRWQYLHRRIKWSSPFNSYKFPLSGEVWTRNSVLELAIPREPATIPPGMVTFLCVCECPSDGVCFSQFHKLNQLC